jgi:dipeptidyl aminopeptidase/acylaminoacyl peptidase
MMMRSWIFVLCLLLSWRAAPGRAAPGDSLRLETVAEKSNFTATSRHADVLDFCARLARRSPLVRLGELGTSHEGREMPLLIVADPPVSTPEEAARSGKLVVFALGNIHAGEVDGKEALLMLARDVALDKERPLLKDLILVFAPNFNPDGGDRLGNNRPHQAGPAEVGTRANAQGFDLNRDFVKLETPEVQALVRFYRRWDPALVVDTHTTNGSYHRYTLTYDGPRHPANSGPLAAFVRDTLLPDVGRRLEKATGYKAGYYGNFDKDRVRWEPTLAQPRYGYHYLGFRNRIGILSESYVYAPYRDRILASRAFVRGCFEFAAEHKEQIRKLLQAADKAERDAAPGIPVALRHKLLPLPQKMTVLGLEGGKTPSAGTPRDYRLDYLGRAEATLTASRPYAYLFSPRFARAVDTLQRHGIEVEELREDIELDVEPYQVEKVTMAKVFQKHPLVTVEARASKETRRIAAGTILVRTGQRLGILAAFLLEPLSEDGLVTWNFFDAELKEGQEYPVLRLPGKVPVTSGKVRPLPEDRRAARRITPEMLDNGTLPNLGGDPALVRGWLDDGEHFLQVKAGQLLKVHAVSGRSEPYRGRAPPAGKKGLFGRGGAQPASQAKDGRELETPSPTKKAVAFVRKNNLYVEDVATKKAQALTSDGSELVLNGKADWVYYEEVFNRKRLAYWWSPDGRHIAFLRTNDGNVPRATVMDHTPVGQLVEITPYPRAGEPNPQVQLGVVPVAGGGVHWVDLSTYGKEPILITLVGWWPDGKGVYCCVQDRAQTWLDFCTVGPEGGPPTRLFRDTTKAWVMVPAAPKVLPDGSFLLTSERSGWKHLYHFDALGQVKGPVSHGPWEVRSVERVDAKGGWVYFTGTRDSHTTVNLYRARLDGTGLERLTQGKGAHSVSLSPRGDLFVDTHSDLDTPPQLRLYRTDGTLVRTLDTNPAYLREEYQLGHCQRVQIPTPDGFLLEASVHKPVSFDPARKYPVWFMTYGGPHAPTIRDAHNPGWVRDEALANMGYIVFRCDPRSASGQGAVAAWTAYRQLGVQELKDIETALRWLTAHPWADATRVGMSGHSYGGFLTAFALTHSKLFAAGIAGAPVTDWRNYDSVYTERYMNTPRENPKGYEATSVVKAAKNLHGRLLLIHGVKDDNVHVQNTLQLVHALQQANKDFEVMLYPLSRHGIGGTHYQRLTRDFMKRLLQPQP